MDSANTKAVELCKELIDFAFLAGPTCEDCPARKFCGHPISDEDVPVPDDEDLDEEDFLTSPSSEDCRRVFLKWLSYELGIPFAFDCSEEDDD